MPLSHLSACRYPRHQYNVGANKHIQSCRHTNLDFCILSASFLSFLHFWALWTCALKCFEDLFPSWNSTLSTRWHQDLGSKTTEWFQLFITEQFSKTFYEKVKRVEFIQVCLVSSRKKSSISIPDICMSRNFLFNIKAYVFLWITKKGIW